MGYFSKEAPFDRLRVSGKRLDSHSRIKYGTGFVGMTLRQAQGKQASLD